MLPRAVSSVVRIRLQSSTRPALQICQALQLRTLSSALEAATLPSRPVGAQASFVRRIVLFTGRSILFASLGLMITLAPAYESAMTIMSPPTDTDSLSLFTPLDDEALAKEDFINSHPLALSLRDNPDLVESRPHMKIPPAWRKHNLTGGTLMGAGKVIVPPFSWTEKNGKSFVQILHVGTDLCGHMGIVHGGFLATVLDEGLGRCCFPVLPLNIGMTAKLEINYKAPALANQYLVLRATTVKAEGRKAWVEGHLETLPMEEGQEPVVLATASALYISPRQASTMAKVYPVT